MEVVFGPNSVDEPNLLYKLQRKIKVFNNSNSLPNRGYNLVASASKYGIVFIASPDGNMTVYHLQQLIDKECEPQHMTVKLQEKPTHIAASCDQEFLAVTGGQLLCIFKIADFQNVNVPSLSISCDVSPSTFVSALQWNPCIPDTIALAFYDGTLLMAQVSTSQIKKVSSKARCLCWSPKGKQIVTGNNDGTLSQYKPDLTLAKTIPTPNLFENASVEALAVYWISTFQFAVVYKNATDNSRPAVTIINTPKAGQPCCQNYEDVCYSMGLNRPWYYYLTALAQWNIIMTSSSNSMEIATLGSADGVNWVQWCQTDEARPELPLTNKKQENYPVGVCIDTCATVQLQWDENTTLPHMPLLHVVSQTGLLTIFNIINLNKQAAQVCTPPLQLILPAAGMTNVIPGKAPAPTPPPDPAPAPAPAIPPKSKIMQAVQLTQTQQPQQQAQSSQYSVLNIPKPPSYTQTQTSPAFTAAPVQVEQKPTPVEVMPTPVVLPTPPMAQSLPMAPKPQPAQAQENAALKAEQEKINEKKANQELKNMLVKEVNDFQMELYNFMVKTRETQAKLQRDIDSINANFNYHAQDAENLKKDCSLDDLRGAIVQLKLELVRACAVVAEARSHAEAKDQHQWTQADPLTTKRVASVKKLAYYVQSQMERAQKALDYQWNEAMLRESQFNKPGQHMIRPLLDDVYQPLVKQQEILSRQQAVLRTLRNTLNECDVTPMFKSTSLLRSTPFKNKDPLSKLTKNILNMSIDTADGKNKDPLLTPQKLDALRDTLSNHKTVKIKPVNVEMRQHLATMRQLYEKSLKEKAQSTQQVSYQPVLAKPTPTKTEPDFKPQANTPVYSPFVEPKLEPKEPKPEPITVTAFTPVAGGLSHVARTLFNDSKPYQYVEGPYAAKPPSLTPPKPEPPAPMFSNASVSVDTRSVLKDLLENKQAKNNANTFMGQNICSPSSFAPTTTAATYTSTPPSVITANVYSKFQPQSFIQESKPQAFAPEVKPQALIPETKTKAFTPDVQPQAFTSEVKSTTFAPEAKPIGVAPESKPTVFAPEIKPTVFASEARPLAFAPETKPSSSIFASAKLTSETGEPEIETKTEKPKTEKLITNLFAMKTSTPVTSPNVPDILKSNQDTKTDKKNYKPVDKEKSKENISEKVDPKVIQKPGNDKKEALKPLTEHTVNKSSTFDTTTQPIVSSSFIPTPNKLQKPVEIEAETEIDPPAVDTKDTPISNDSSINIAANASGPAVTKEQPDTPIPKQSSFITATSEPTPTDSESSPKPSLFLNITTPSPSAATVFGTAVASQPQPTSPAASLFAAAVSSSSSVSSIFGSASQGSIFGNTSPTTTTSVFGANAQSVFSGATNPAVFSTPTPSPPNTPPSPSSVFGSAATVTTPSGSIFSSSFSQPSVFAATTTAAPPSPTSVFGSSTTSSVFGSTITTQASIFGAPTTTSPSVFGTATATTQASIFGSAVTSAPSAFISTTTASPVAQSIFASANTATPSVFGGSGTSVFGSTSPTNQTSVFGTPSPQASVFGSAPATTQASVFGSPTPTSQASVFGTQPTTTTQSSSLFGGAEASLFASASISTTSAPSQTSGGSIFGGSSPSSVFGNGNTNVFGGKTAFGQPNPTAAAIFGGGGATAFGQQKPANNFWGSGNANNENAFGASAFGQQPTTQASSIFGNNTGGSFSTPSPAGQAFGSPQATAFGTNDNKPSVFGSPQQQTGTTSAFGGSSVFSSKPAFGQPSGFGSPPSGGGFGSSFGGFNKSPGPGFGAPAAFGGGATFGGGAAFGSTSPGQMFGGAQPTGFGSPTQSNATFERIATQNTLTFGNLAQQAQSPQQQAPSFNTSPSFTGWRG